MPEDYSNPIIKGAYSDPSICRVNDYYYLTNSSVEWFPGLPIHRSKDLVNWELIGYGMKNRKHDFIRNGTFDSGGIFAPTIRYYDGLFYIIATHICGRGNFYITATDPVGEWSEPVWLDAKGIDPSLFWDDDGKCYYVGNANLSGKKSWFGQAGVWMQELDLSQKKLVGEPKQLTFGHATNARWAEGPHLYKIKGKYVLLLAEGGTDIYHAETCFVSDSVWGEYVPSQVNPILTHRHLGKDYPVYAVGHADMVETQNGDWWMVSLGKRRGINGECYIGRETFLSPVEIEEFKEVDGKESICLIVNPGGGIVPIKHKRPDLLWSPVAGTIELDDFITDKLNLEWVFLRTPMTDWYSLDNGKLVIDLRPEVASEFVNPSMIVRRVKEHKFGAFAKMKFSGNGDNEEAGIILYRSSQYYAMIMRRGEFIVVSSVMNGVKKDLATEQVSSDEVVLHIESDGRDITFFCGDKKQVKFDCSVPLEIISDKYQRSGGYGGTMMGMYATSNGKPSDNKVEFDCFSLQY